MADPLELSLQHLYSVLNLTLKKKQRDSLESALVKKRTTWLRTRILVQALYWYVASVKWLVFCGL